MPSIDVHEEFPTVYKKCGDSAGWTDPIEQANWGSWTTVASGNSAGMFLDQIAYTCRIGAETCDPEPHRDETQPLGNEANAFAPVFMFVGSKAVGGGFTTRPLMQVRYTDHGRDEVGYWQCPE